MKPDLEEPNLDTLNLQELVVRAKSTGDPELREKAIVSCERTIQWVVGTRLSRFELCAELKKDLLQEGFEVVTQQFGTYDPSRGVRFTTHIVNPIYWACLEYIRKQNGQTKLINQRLKKLQTIRHQLEQDRGQRPTVQQLAAAMGCDVEEIEWLYMLEESIASLDAPIGGEGEESLLDVLQDGSEPVLAEIERAEMRTLVRQSVIRLKPRYRETVVLLYYKETGEFEAARRLKLSIDGLKSRRKKALKLLREDLNLYFRGESGSETIQ